MYLFMKAVGNSRFSSLVSAVLYMLSPQTLYGRFFIGHFTHNFSMFLIPLTFFCIVKYGSNVKKTALITAPLFAMFFLSHLQTALSFGFMLGIYFFFKLFLGEPKEKTENTSMHLSGLLLGGLLGFSLASFWLLPSLLEGLGKLSLTGDAALKTVIPIESLFVNAKYLWYLSPTQRIWSKQYFLGFPLILLFFLAVTLIIKRKLTAEKTFWGIIFISWVALFLFGIVSPHIGLILGWPNRLPYFVSMSMAMLAGIAVDWIEGQLSSSLKDARSFRRMAKYSILAIIVLSPLIHTFNVNQFVYYPYSNEIQVSKLLDELNKKPTERAATFGTASYVFNVFSDEWQLDGGYVQGQINPDFYRKYWLTLTKSNDLNSVLNMLDKTNTRYIIFPRRQATPSVYEDQRFFEKIETDGFIIFKLKDNYTLNFVTLLDGEALINYSYTNPDQLHIKAWYCSRDVTIAVKMNYYPGWKAQSTRGEVKLIRDSDGLMKIEILNADSTDVTLQYAFTQIDYIAFGVTIAGAVIYLLIFLPVIWKAHEGWIHTHHTGTYIDLTRRKKKKRTVEEPSRIVETPTKTPEILPKKEEKTRISKETHLISWIYHLASIILVSIYALYISWPYLTATDLPAFVDAPGHAFKIWYIIDSWTKYKVIPYFWDSWWYAGYPFLQVYPPLSYMIAAFSGLVFLGGNPIAGLRLATVLSNVLAAAFMYIGVYMLFKSRMGGIVGGIVYASSAYRGAAVRTGMFPFYIATMFLPLIVPFYDRSLSSKNLKNYAFSASALALILLSHMQMFVYAVLTLALYMVIISILGFHGTKILFLKKFMKNVKILFLVIILGLCLVGFWIIPFFSYRSFFYTRYPEFYLKIQSISNVHLFFQKGGGVYLGLTTLSLIILVFFISKRARKDSHMIFFAISGLLSGFLSLYQYEAFKGTIIEQMPYYHMITPERWVFITFLSLAFLAGGATKYICDLLEKFNFFSQSPQIRSFWRGLLTSIILCLIIFDAGGSLVRGFYGVPVIQSFPSAVKDFPDEDEYYRIYANIVGLAYVPAVSNRESLPGWYIEGSVLRDWLYNLDWMTSYGKRENLIAPFLELFATRYYIARSDDLNRIERFKRTGEFNISYKGDYCVMKVKRPIKYINVRHPILYLGKKEDLLNIVETLLFSSNSSILIPGWKQYVDDYTVEELSKFDAILISRYDCLSQSKMDDLLLRYGSPYSSVLFHPHSWHAIILC